MQIINKKVGKHYFIKKVLKKISWELFARKENVN